MKEYQVVSIREFGRYAIILATQEDEREMRAFEFHVENGIVMSIERIRLGR